MRGFIFLLTILVISFAIAADYRLEIVDYSEGVLTLMLHVLYKPFVRPSMYLYGPMGFIRPSKVENGVYEFKVGSVGFVIPMIFGKNSYGVPMMEVSPSLIDISILSHTPSLMVLSDIKEEGVVYKYIKLRFHKEWKLDDLTIDGKRYRWFTWNGSAVVVTKDPFKDGTHVLSAEFDLPYGYRKKMEWKLFSFKGVLVRKRGDVMPYVVERIPPYTHIVMPGESLWKIAKKYGIRVGDLILINGLKDPNLIYAGEVLKLGRVRFIDNPTVIVVNLFTAKMGLYYDGKLLKVFPVAIGRSDSTPPGKYWVLRKEINPALYWYGEYISPDSPINGLGTRYLQLSDPRYAIHGTSKPWEIGRRISHGCIRMFNSDVELLDSFAGVGSTVIVIKKDIDFKENIVDVLEGTVYGKMVERTNGNDSEKR